MRRLGRDHIFASKSDAIKAIYERVDQSACLTCTSRIFYECPALRRAKAAKRPVRKRTP
jgi:hypothetical protein